MLSPYNLYFIHPPKDDTTLLNTYLHCLNNIDDHNSDNLKLASQATNLNFSIDLMFKWLTIGN